MPIHPDTQSHAPSPATVGAPTVRADGGRRRPARTGPHLLAVLLAGLAVALLAVAPAATSATVGKCSKRAVIGNAWGDHVSTRACISYLRPAVGGGKWMHARSETEAWADRNTFRTCDSRVSVTMSGGTRGDAGPHVADFRDHARFGTVDGCALDNGFDFVLRRGRTAVVHANSSVSIFLGTYADWYWMNSWEWGGTAHSPSYRN